jgi:hypothetical protein
MANLDPKRPVAKQEIIFFQTTVDCLKNNSIMTDIYNLAKKILDEGYSLIFHGYNGTPTTIESPTHLKGYINHVTGFKHI